MMDFNQRARSVSRKAASGWRTAKKYGAPVFNYLKEDPRLKTYFDQAKTGLSVGKKLLDANQQFDEGEEVQLPTIDETVQGAQSLLSTGKRVRDEVRMARQTRKRTRV